MPGVHRNLDSRLCGARTDATGQSTVYVDGVLVAVEGDIDNHSKGGALKPTNNSVYVNGKKLSAIGDPALTDTVGDQTHHNTNAKDGSTAVFVN